MNKLDFNEKRKNTIIIGVLAVGLLLVGSFLAYTTYDYVTAADTVTVESTVETIGTNNVHSAMVGNVPGNTDIDNILDEEKYEEDPEFIENFLTVTVSSTKLTAPATKDSVNVEHRTLSDEEIINMSENDCWKYLSCGMIKSYPAGPFTDYVNTLNAIRSRNAKTINVKCWFWEDPSDQKNMNKVTVTKSFVVNAGLAQLFEHAFEDIYNDPSKPIINIKDGGMGTWVIRGKCGNPNRRMSTHSLGSCIDINPSTGSFRVNGSWYGNGYGQKTMTKAIWKELPENHNKYHVLYAGCPIVEIFKSYGFVWGGDWSSTKDCMHLSFIGEGSNTRASGQANYNARK